MILAKVTGVNKVIANLKKANIKIGGGLERGLKLGGVFLQRESQSIVPVLTGALKNSAFTRKFGGGIKTDVIVGYTQDYATNVHENLQARHKPGKCAKYLEKPAREKRSEIVAIIAAEAGKP